MVRGNHARKRIFHATLFKFEEENNKSNTIQCKLMELNLKERIRCILKKR